MRRRLIWMLAISSVLVCGFAWAEENQGVAPAAVPASPKPGVQSGRGVIAGPAVRTVAGGIAAPQHLAYSNSPQVCAAHIHGLGAALVCPGIIASAKVLPLVWDWAPCHVNGCLSQIEGYHIYRVPAGNYRHLDRSPTLVDSQPDQNTTIRGISPFSKTDCFLVTAYKGSEESEPSNVWCGRPNLPMGIAMSDFFPVKRLTIWQHSPTSCAPTSIWKVEENTAQHGVVLPKNSPSTNPCFATDVYHGYLGFTFDLSGGVQKATFITYPAPCIAGVMKTQSASWFATIGGIQAQTPRSNNPQGAKPFAKEPGAPIPFDNSSQRPFQLAGSLPSYSSPNNAQRYEADVTPWFSSTRAGSYTFGLSFYLSKPGPSCFADLSNSWIEITYYPSE